MANVDNEHIDPLIAELLRARKSAGLRQQDVADKAGISRRSLVSIEAGGDCTLSTLRALGTALGVGIDARRSGKLKRPALRAETAASRGFATAKEMSSHQEQRELAEALRVQAMQPFERSRWLKSTWAPLQRQALGVRRDPKLSTACLARHFATMDEKNQYDDQQELERALHLALSRGAPR